MLCRAFGLTFSTEVPLPGSVRAADVDRIDVEITRGDVPPWVGQARWGPYRVASPDLFDFNMAGVARYTVLHRRRVVVTPESGTEASTVSEMLIATALPALFWSRGDIVLHAAAAASSPDSPGWLLLGPSGAGKSTRLMRTVQSGAYAVADDSVRIWVRNGRLMAAGLPAGAFVRCRGGQGRSWLDIPPERCLDCTEIDRAFVIEPGKESRGRLVGVTALIALLRHRHRPRILQLLSSEPDTLATMARVSGLLQTTAIGPQDVAP